MLIELCTLANTDRRHLDTLRFLLWHDIMDTSGNLIGRRDSDSGKGC